MLRRSRVLADGLAAILAATHERRIELLALDALFAAGLDPERRCRECGGWASVHGRRRTCDACRWKRSLVSTTRTGD